MRLHDVPVFAYDGSIGPADFFRRMLRRPWSPRVIVKNGLLLSDFALFFSNRRRNYYRTYVGSRSLKPNLSFTEVFAALTSSSLAKPFLKIDIECSEYDILEELVKFAGSTAGLAIEFHACESRLDEVVRFVDAYPLQLVHVHVNNHCAVQSNGLPGLLELTFSASAVGEVVLPHLLDRPNDPRKDEFAIGFT